jgi:hypothetical protein
VEFEEKYFARCKRLKFAVEDGRQKFTSSTAGLLA